MTSEIKIPKALFLFFGVLLLSLLLGGGTIYAQHYYPLLQGETDLVTNVALFLLVNSNIAVMMVVGFMVITNVVKLILDRRRNILGARLRFRLVGAFVGLSLVPTVLLFLVSKGILENVFQEWFSPQISSVMEGSLEVASFVYDQEEGRLYRYLEHMANDVTALVSYGVEQRDGRTEITERTREPLQKYLNDKVREYGLTEVLLANEIGEVLVSSDRQGDARLHILPPSPRAVQQALSGTIVVRPEQSLNGEFLRGYTPLRLPSYRTVVDRTIVDREVINREGNVYSTTKAPETSPSSNTGTPLTISLVATSRLSPELNGVLSTIISAYDDYKELGAYRRPLGSSYVLTLIAFTLVIVFLAVWIGFYLVKGLFGPIQQLVEGTAQVAHGNLEYQIPEVGDDELNSVVRSFNKMTEDLRATTLELDSRRRYMETVLESVGVGVVSLDEREAIATANGASLVLFEVKDFQGKRFSTVLPNAVSTKVRDLLDELSETGEKERSADVTVEIQRVPRQIQVKATKLVGEDGQVLGSVLLFDDLTELVNAQRMAAWREVARRIAHEIKNPLTPIQLSAQRLQRKFAGSAGEESMLPVRDREIVKTCADTIVHQVETLRVLVNEFSRFARMPKIHPRPGDLNLLLKETVVMYQELEGTTHFVVDLDPNIPEFDFDAEQLGRVLVNLMDNAMFSVREKAKLLGAEENRGVHALLERSRFLSRLAGLYESRFKGGDGGFQPEIVISSQFNKSLGLATILVSDNGQGIKELDKAKLFEPYFSTKKGGTGLGLAIVNTIVADHNGFIRVRDNPEGGATFVIELPATRRRMENTG